MAFKFGTQKSLGLGIIGGGGPILKPQDVFNPVLWIGNSQDRTIVTGFKPDLMWHKDRGAGSNILSDTSRGTNVLFTDTTSAETDYGINAMSSVDTGARIIATANINQSGKSNVLWPFKKAPRFFDIVTWTGDGTASRQIPHGLGVVPGMVIVKSRTSTTGWPVWHRGITNSATDFLTLQTTNAAVTAAVVFGANPTATTFTVGSNASTNNSGDTYVAYLLAHDPSADGIVQCGSFTGTPATINLGWPAQFFMHKRTDATDDWYIYDTARGFGSGADKLLRPNTSAAEQSFDFGEPTSTGVTVNGGATAGTSIYLAIRAPY